MIKRSISNYTEKTLNQQKDKNKTKNWIQNRKRTEKDPYFETMKRTKRQFGVKWS